jgi:pyrroloquinoline quinone biosynthesis protein B
MNAPRLIGALAASLLLSGTAYAQEPACQIELVVLGAGQDAGAPQIGNADDTGPRLLPSSLGLIDREAGTRYLFDASPEITQQLAALDRSLGENTPPQSEAVVDGVFLTHAHIGHYLGLAFLGFEAANADSVPVYTMPRMAEFLRGNAPWNQLVAYNNIAITEMADGALVPVNANFAVSPLLVPHRDELSETVGIAIVSALNAALYLPDLDSWDEWEASSGYTLEALIENVDYAFLDATFWDDNELLDENGEGRDMSAIPHPRVSAVMDRLQHLPADERAKVHFIHYNHTNPVRDPDSAQSVEVRERGFNVARRGDRHCLASAD